MTADEAKTAISGLADANRIQTTIHARERMTQRSITYRDLRNALVNASTCVASAAEGRWVVTGLDLDGEDTKVVCAIEDGVVVITVF